MTDSDRIAELARRVQRLEEMADGLKGDHAALALKITAIEVDSEYIKTGIDDLKISARASLEVQQERWDEIQSRGNKLLYVALAALITTLVNFWVRGGLAGMMAVAGGG